MWIFFLSLLFIFSEARAGFETRNGGFVMECRTSDGSRDVVLDLITPGDGFDKGWTLARTMIPLETRVQMILGQLAAFDAPFSLYLQHEAQSLMRNMSFVDRLTSDDLRVRQEVLWDGLRLEENFDCRNLRQAASQIHMTPELRMLFVVKNIWDRLDDTQRAALIVHEVIYGFVIRRPVVSPAFSTRELVQNLFDPVSWSFMTQNIYDVTIRRRYFTSELDQSLVVCTADGHGRDSCQ